MGRRVTPCSMKGIVRSLGRALAGARIAARTALPVDSNPVPGDWAHVTKVDPELEKRLPLAYPLYLQHTDAVSVGGSRDVTSRNTEATFELLEYVPTPAFHEPSAPRHVTDATHEHAAFMAIPEVLNGDVESLVGQMGAGIEYIRGELVPEMLRERAPWLPPVVRDPVAEFATSWMLAEANFEAYIIQNPDSAAAREAGVDEDDVLAPDEAARRAMAAERRIGSEVLYVEYSGTYGGQEGQKVVEAIDDATTWSRLWYGGGIDSREAATDMLDAGADAVIVGDAFHEIAEEEADLAARALEELSPDADLVTVEEWIVDRRDLADTEAARYLSTIPSVDRPEATALDYLATGVWLRLRIEALATEAEDVETPADLRSLLDEPLPGRGQFAELGDRGDAYARALTASLLGARLGIEVDELQVDHLGVGAGLLTDAEA